MRIVIVEDEIRIREGLNKLLNRIDGDYQVVGEAENGQAGLALIRKLKPDLVITDVQMPLMDGLKMLHELQDQQRLPRVIILSAYSEFSYAQQAIKLGVSEYLIKPIMISELTQSLRAVEQQLKSDSQKGGGYSKLRSFEEVLKGIQSGRLQVNKELESYISQTFSVDAAADFVLVLAYLGKRYEAERKRTIPNLHSLLKNMISKDCQMLEHLAFQSNLFIFPCKEEENNLEKRFQRTILPRLDRSGGICFGWIKFTGLRRLMQSIDVIQNHMDWCITLGSEVLVQYPKVTKVHTTPLPYPVEIENQMRTAMCMMDNDRISKVFREFERYFSREMLYEPHKIKECYVRFLWAVMNVAKELDLSKFLMIEQQALLERIMNAVTSTELQGIMEEFLRLLPENEGEENQTRLVIRRTKSLIHEFFARGITLEEIADKLNVTPEYLGSQFHKEVGMTFSAYMKEYRIQKAKKLLIGTNLKLYEIARQIGYGDPKHFSKVFREITGQLPAEYRKMNK